MNWNASRTSAIVDQQPTVATVANNQQPTVTTAAENFYAIFCSKIRKKSIYDSLRPSAHWVDTTRRDKVSPLPSTPCDKKNISVEWIPRILNQRDATHTYMIKIIHRQLVINIIGANILHKNFPVLKCYEDFYIELDCPLPVG